jgi:hypothetical protein
VSTSFLTLQPGTAVVDRFGAHAGAVDGVLLLDGGGFDRIVVRTRVGRRFVDAPEVRRISGGAVTLAITVSDVECAASNARRVYGIPAARHDRTQVTEADRDEAIECLKRLYVSDALSTDDLAERVAIAHLAVTLDELDAALANTDLDRLRP